MRREYLWALLTLIIAVALALVLLTVAQDEPRSQPVPELKSSVYDKKLLRLDRRGVDAAYSARVALLFQNWMTDTNKESQDRALRGHRNAREVYVKVVTGIDARDPPTEDDLK